MNRYGEHVVAYDLPLRENLVVRLVLPFDFSEADADRLCAIIRTIAFPDEQIGAYRRARAEAEAAAPAPSPADPAEGGPSDEFRASTERFITENDEVLRDASPIKIGLGHD